MLKMVENPVLPLYAKYALSAVVVVWIALAGGSWLGRALLVSQVFGEKDEQVEFRNMPEPRARPWVKVDPELEQEVENLRRAVGTSVINAKPAGRAKSADPGKGSLADDGLDLVTATPVADILVPSKGKFVLQFGSFVDSDNAQKLSDLLKSESKTVTVEKIDSKAGVLYRVKGPSFDTAQLAEQSARELRLQGFQVIVVGD